ncbi:hypothetical protein IGI04_029578 [Brassica rapa subsp. trilocularis]|uniref:Uncharacterized protein n=1 Tax=Brassica rapa subsp. trilocularis TaxID=1813537 RepID=A0ABQ7LN86_BRACM|nr:hypothetical protein IGI04_029578 [Brassica rapa subsp. trilocularis]
MRRPKGKTRLLCSTRICKITFGQTIPFPNLHFHGPSPSHALSPNLSLNSAAAADPTQPPDPSQLPSSAISIGDKVPDSTLSYLDLTTVLSKESPSPP